MLHVDVFSPEEFDNSKQEFISEKLGTLTLEHSLVSLSKWESKFEKPFVSQAKKTDKETLYYIECMSVVPEPAPELLKNLSQANIDEIQKYIDAKMTATWFPEEPNKGTSGEAITSELVYYWLIALNIPFECQYWHLNRLLTLIQVCNRKNAPQRKMSQAEIRARQSQLNKQRRAELGTSG